MFDRILSIVLAAFFLMNAHSVITTGSCYVIYGHYFDFGGLKNIVGVAFGIFGILLLLYGILGDIIGRKEEKPNLPEFTVCPKCKESFWGNDTPDLKCKKCGHNLEEMNGYYKRHPENGHQPSG